MQATTKHGAATAKAVLSFEEALATVREKLNARQAEAETLPLSQTRGRVLAEDVGADRDYPPFHRSMRDGYAVRAAEVAAPPATLASIGEARAGAPFDGTLENQPAACVHIMTGAPLPAGADAVVMQEYTRPKGPHVEILRSVAPGENVVERGSEAPRGGVVLGHGRRLGAGEIGLLASVGRARVRVFRQPTVAILSTGDEVVPIEQEPRWFQIRNSNALALEAQVASAGGVPLRLPIAPDQKEPLRRLIEQGLEADLLLLSGGVSVGQYDFVEAALRELGAEVYFSSVALRPGKPLTFGRAREKFFFGLPGNPVSTFVTFELFARPAIQALAGALFQPPIFLRARLGKALGNKSGLTTFMPARVEAQGSEPVVRLVGWQGSGDLVGVAAANCFLVAHPHQIELREGEWVDVLQMDA